jgi:ABC-type molybdate transport system substrate-binding protein
VKGRIYWETIPPGLLIDQIKAGARITVGNMTWTAKPDAYLAGLRKVNGLIDEGLLIGPSVPYVTNTLAIMVPKGNPANIKSLADLGRPGVRLAMPNPAFEGIARQIKMALTKAGGQALADAVYDAKVKDGSTILTHIHHRQTPLFLMQGVADAGVTWVSKAIFQEQAGNPIAYVPIPDADNATAAYAGAQVAGAAHPQAAKAWLDFIRSPEALRHLRGLRLQALQEELAMKNRNVARGLLAVVVVGAVGAFAWRMEYLPARAAAPAPMKKSEIPKGKFGDVVQLGEKIFREPATYAAAYVGNDLRCSNCHLEAGRLAGAAPMGAAYVACPAYRAKNGHVNSFEERLGDCFRYSMNGKDPPLGDPILVALESYSFFLARGLPTGEAAPGRGFPELPTPPLLADYARGGEVYAQQCAVCHGADGHGQYSGGKVVFPRCGSLGRIIGARG